MLSDAAPKALLPSGMATATAVPTSSVTRFLTPRQAAERLGLSPQTLAKARHLGTDGYPPFVKLGHAVRYPEPELEAFIESLPRRRSTSDRPPEAA